MRNWIVLGLVFGMCLTCVGRVEAKKRVVKKKGNASEEVTKKEDSSVTNIALNKPVTASSVESEKTEPVGAVDGNLSTRWASKRTDPQWIRIDLGSVCNIKKVVLNWEAAYGKSYEIQVSNNDADWTTIYTKTDGTGGKEEISLSGKGRYIRMFGTARGTKFGYSLWEFEVYK
ncbi:MAG: discoidin domain-containing protein [Elusimicrobia bacterium]|nr:discoidin domain-containing protein [Elusimicrobiota bacterium]